MRRRHDASQWHGLYGVILTLVWKLYTWNAARTEIILSPLRAGSIGYGVYLVTCIRS